MRQFKVGRLYTNGIDIIKILRITSEQVIYEWKTGAKYENFTSHRGMEHVFGDFKLKLEFKDYYNEIRF